jgi:Zn-dependent oligopeptidase
MEHPEVQQFIEGQVFSAIDVAILQKAEEVESSTIVLDFDNAQRKLSELTDIISHLPGVTLTCDINAIQRHMHDCVANQDNEVARQKHLAALKEELAEANRSLDLVRERLDRTSNGG